MPLKPHWLALGLFLAIPAAAPVVPWTPAFAQSRIGAGEIDALLRLLPPDITARYASVTTTGDTTVIERMTLTRGDVTVTIERLSATSLDLPGLATALSAPRPGTAPDTAYRRLAGRFGIEGLTVARKGEQQVRLGSLTLTDLSLRPFARSPFDTRWQSHDAAIAGFQTLGLWLDALKVGRLTIERLGADVTLEDDALSQQLLFSADRIDFDGLEQGRLGPIEFMNYNIIQRVFQAGVPAGAVAQQLKATRFDGMDVGPLLPFMLKGELPPPEARPYLSMGAWVYEGWSVHVHGIGTFEVPRAELAAVPFQWVIPSRIDFAVEGTFAPEPAARFAGGPDLRALFLDKAPFTLSTGWTFDIVAGTAELTRYGLGLGGWGTVEAGARLVDIDLKETRGPVDEVMALAGARIRVRDDGGVDKALGLLAEDGLVPAPPATARRFIAGQISEMAGTPPFAGWQRVRASAEAVIAFIQSGGEITLTATPPVPLNAARRAEVERANDPETLWNAWGVSAAHAR